MFFEEKWWRRRESNPRPKGLSLQNSTCVSVLGISLPATKNGECAGSQPECVSSQTSPGACQDQPTEWRSFPTRRLEGTNVASLVRPRAQAASPQLRCVSTGLTREMNNLGTHSTAPCPRRSLSPPSECTKTVQSSHCDRKPAASQAPPPSHGRPGAEAAGSGSGPGLPTAVRPSCRDDCDRPWPSARSRPARPSPGWPCGPTRAGHRSARSRSAHR